VTLEPFLLSKFEMTQGQWHSVTGEQPSLFPIDVPRGRETVWASLPVESVSHTQAEAVLRRRGLCLPTEAQWEYAARAGSPFHWWCGDEAADIGRLRAGNLLDQSANRPDWGDPEPWNDGFQDVAPVGSFQPNAFGLHDVIGNVMEWCADSFGVYGLPVREGDGLRLVPADQNRGRVYRGGSFDFPSIDARSA